MKKLFLLFTIILIVTTNKIQSQNDSIYFWKSGLLLKKRSVKTADLDSITFKINYIKICGQVWAKKNLDVSTYSDGTSIPQVTDAAWNNLTTGAWCYYGNNEANNAVYGKLYNWYAVAGIYDAASLTNPALRKKLAPTGWHVPSDAEWTTLTTCLGGGNVAAYKILETGQTSCLAATNSSGFTGLLGSYRMIPPRGFGGLGGLACWWSSSTVDQSNAWMREVGCNLNSIFRYSSVNQSGYSVRCLRN